jgi:hypothetical protein
MDSVAREAKQFVVQLRSPCLDHFLSLPHLGVGAPSRGLQMHVSWGLADGVQRPVHRKAPAEGVAAQPAHEQALDFNGDGPGQLSP